MSYQYPLLVYLTNVLYQYALPVFLTSIPYQYALPVYPTSMVYSISYQYSLPVCLTIPYQYALPVSALYIPDRIGLTCSIPRLNCSIPYMQYTLYIRKTLRFCFLPLDSSQ